ncbi:MAG: HutD family protein [Aquimonas sp.]|nr:HutD family protein [Aquimonas sp.]
MPRSGFRTQLWRNSGGLTREIYIAGGDDGQPDCRLSLARIESDGLFSEFPGIQRQQLLVSGAGLTLDFEAAPSIPLHPPFGLARYPGTPAPCARLQDGAVEVLNLFHRPRALDAELFHRPLLGSMLFFARPTERWLLLLLAGHAQVRGPGVCLQLEQGDACLLQGESGRACVEGGGDLALVRMLTGVEADT